MLANLTSLCIIHDVNSLNPEILSWARETAGLSLEAAAKKIGLNAARGISGADRLAELEHGKGVPSRPLLLRMAQHYHRPLLTFYLPKKPEPPELGQDFRTLPDQGDTSNVLLSALLRDVKARQSLVRDFLEDDEDISKVELVGACANVKLPSQLAAAIVNYIEFDQNEYRSRNSIAESFAYLRGLVEDQGIFVLLAGDCGHWSTAIDVRIFRGFAIADELAPFIVINDQDAKTAWSFTLLHELAHLLIGETGISGGAPQRGVEQLCNDAAAAVLMSKIELADISLSGNAGDIQQIDTLANKARVSRSMVAYQLFRTGRITLDRWEVLRDLFRKEWLETKEKNRERSKTREGGPNWYVVRRHRLGAALLAVARQGIADGSLTPSRAARMLGIKPMAVYPLLADPRRVYG